MPSISHTQSGAGVARSLIHICIVDSNSYTRSRIGEMAAAEEDFIVKEFTAASELFTGVQPDAPFVCLIHQPSAFTEHLHEYISMRKKYRQIRMLLLHEPCAAVLATSLSAGFRGFYAESLDSNNLISAIRAVHNGTIWISGVVDASLEQVANAYAPAKSSTLITNLTDREIAVLSFIAIGQTNREIAENLFVSVATIKANLRSVFHKLQVTDRTQAAVVAWERGLIVREKEPI